MRNIEQFVDRKIELEKMISFAELRLKEKYSSLPFDILCSEMIDIFKMREELERCINYISNSIIIDRIDSVYRDKKTREIPYNELLLMFIRHEIEIIEGRNITPHQFLLGEDYRRNIFETVEEKDKYEISK